MVLHKRHHSFPELLWWYCVHQVNTALISGIKREGVACRRSNSAVMIIGLIKELCGKEVGIKKCSPSLSRYTGNRPPRRIA
jgi:hypothetical protein